MISRWQSYKLADRSMAAMKSMDVAEWRDARMVEVSPSTVHRELCLLSHLFTVAQKDWGFAIQNPVAMTRKPRPAKGRERRLSEAEIDKILDASESAELPAIVRLLTETAMRRGELSKLRWENIDLKHAIAHLEDTKNGRIERYRSAAAPERRWLRCRARLMGKYSG